MMQNNTTRGGHLTPIQRNARVRAANRIKELLAVNNIEHHVAERKFAISSWMMSKIRVNPEAVALPRLLEILKDIQEYVGKPDAPDKVAGEPTPLSEEDFEPAPKPAPVPVKARAGADPVKLLTEAIEVHRRTGMTPLELLDYMNAANRVVEMMNRMNTT